MFFVTLKVSVFRYMYVKRQRWLLTSCYLLFPVVLCFLVVLLYDSLGVEKYVSWIQEHDERTILTLPRKDNCSLDGPNCRLKLVVCPGGPEEQELMNRVEEIFRLDNTSALDITFVNNSDLMVDMLVGSNSSDSKGLLFHQITATKLEYTMRPLDQGIPTIYYDWGDYATTERFPSPMYRGPRLTDPYFNVENKYFTLTGLLTLQVAIDKAYLQTYFPNVSKEWILVSFPHPPYEEFSEQIRSVLSHRFYLILVQFMLMMGITLMVTVFASHVIYDRSSGIQEWMCLNGANRLIIHMTWLLSFCFEATILAIIEMVVMRLPTENGPTIKYMSPLVLLIVLVVYNCMSLCWVHLLALFFSKQVLCVMIIAAYWVFSLSFHWIPPDHFVMQGVLATLPNAGLIIIFKSFLEFDGAETVLGMDRLHTHPIHYLPVGILLLIMFATLVLLVLLSIYVDLVKPGRYGRAKPWYLFSRKDKTPDGADEAPNEGKFFEKPVRPQPAALECVKISKSFNKHKVIDNISMKVPKNKITILLGHNGAGKTTLLSILSGIYSPTAGHFLTAEYNVFQGGNLKEFRKVMGYCPQHNWLISELTVKQHCILFGLLKGFTRAESEAFCDEQMAKFQMEKFETTRARKLSGGTKRKLCLAIAMIGDPLYLLLDEPSLGLDAESTSEFRNILLLRKLKCTVILATSDMEEAELIGDQIAFIENGQLKGFGARSFLKKQLGFGYKLNCTINEKDTPKLKAMVRNFDPSTKILHQTNNAITFGFPSIKSKELPNLMKNMNSVFGEKIAFSLSNASMDDVFMKLQHEVQTEDNPGFLHEGRQSAVSKKPSTAHWGVLKTHSNENQSFSCGQMVELVKKRLKWLKNRGICELYLLVVIPIIGIVLTMWLINQAIGVGSSKPHPADLTFKMDEYDGTVAFVSKREDAITRTLIEAMKAGGFADVSEIAEDMFDFLSNLAKKDLFHYRSNIVFAFDSGETGDSATAYYSRNAFHSAPIAYSTMINAILLGEATITSHNFPVIGEQKDVSCMSMNHLFISFLFGLILGPSLLITSSYFVLFPCIEKRTIFKHLQLMTGLLPSVYWISHLIVDLLLLSISFLLTIIIMVIMDSGLFLNRTVMLTLIFVLLLYGISTITFAYMCSFCDCSCSTVVILFVAIPPLLQFAYLILDAIFKKGLRSVLPYEVLYIFPWIILVESLGQIAVWASLERECYQCKDPYACAVISSVSLIRSLRIELICFVMTSLAYFVLVVGLDHGFGSKLKAMLNLLCYGDIKDVEGDVDPDVEREKKRVKDFEMDEDEDQLELISDGLGKKYSSTVTAVRDVSFALKRGELLGLLGGNGAGKSTLLKMLSGLVSPSKGLAMVRNKWDLVDCEYKYIRNIGYCPQFYGYLQELTGRNTLRLFGRLRGVKQPFLDLHVDLWLKTLDMTSIANRPCGWYSGGNLKKLSFAISMIGNPSVVLLDEPTAGVDPVVRRRIWDILANSLKQRQAIIITSHTMSEIEAICDRITIMVDGEMKCIGPVPELKNKYGKSCILRVKMKANIPPKQMDAIQSKILRESQFWRFAQLQDRRVNALTISVNTEQINIHDVFADMLKIKDEYLAIDDFTLTQTPLEEIFMNISRPNRPKLKFEKKPARQEPRKILKK